ncbi:MAG: PAS domain S-box protein [Anaerolineaceae bacterium]|nr:PAS domain S-box protein [Anaerolineaceae bacterium]
MSQFASGFFWLLLAAAGVELLWIILHRRSQEIRRVGREKTIENMPDLMFILDEGGVIVDLNNSARQVFSLPQAHLPANLRLQELIEIPANRIEDNISSLNGVPWQDPDIINYKRREYEVHRSPLLNGRKQPFGQIILLHDDTHHRRMERRNKIQFGVSNILSESKNLSEAAQPILKLICDSLGFKCGGIWVEESHGQALQLVNFWCPDQIYTGGIPEKINVKVPFGAGLIGTAWAEGKPHFYDKACEDKGCLFCDVINNPSCQNGLIVPICVGESSPGVMAFFGQGFSQPKELLDLFSAVGSQIGQFIMKRQVEAAFSERQTFFHTLVEVLPQNLYSMDLEGRITFANGRYCATLGRSLDQLIGKTNYDLHSRELADKFFQEMRQVVDAGERIQFIEENSLPDQTIQYNQVIASPIFALNHSVSGVLVIFWEVTENLLAEKALRESEAKYKSLLDQIPVGVYRTAPDGSILHANPAVAAILGYPCLDEVFQHVNARDLYENPTDRDRQHELWKKAEGVSTEIAPFRTHDGRRIWLRDTGRVFLDNNGQIAYIDGILEDITDQKQAEDNLRESEQRYRDLFHAAEKQARELSLLVEVRTALARELDLGAIFSSIVNTVADVFGYPLVSLYLYKGDMLVLQHQVGYENVFPQIPIHKGIIGRAFRTGLPYLSQNTAEDPDYLEIKAEITSEVAIPLFDRGQVVGILNAESGSAVPLDEDDLRILSELSQHISIAIERARLFTKARDNEQKFRSVIEHSVDGIVLVNELGDIIEWNQGQERITGLVCEDVLGHKIWEVEYSLLAPEHKSKEAYHAIKAVTCQALETGNVPTHNDPIDLAIVRPDGVLKYLQIVRSPVKTDNGAILSSITRDITESRHAENDLHRRDAILNAVAFAASQFLKEPSWEQCIQAVLDRLGNATDVQRVYVYQNLLDEQNNLIAARRFTWQDKIDCETAGELPPFVFRYQDLNHWLSAFGKGRCIFGPLIDLSDSERQVFENRCVRSAAMVPIFVGWVLWGFIGFEDCRLERRWSASEIDGLKTAADILGTDIQRSEIEMALRESEAHNKAMLNAIPDNMYRFKQDGTITARKNISPENISVGVNLKDVLSSDIFDKVQQSADLALNTKEIQVFEFERSTPDGDQVYEARLVVCGEQEVMAIVRDISERAHLEQMKSDFINRAAHDLRTPLTTATMMADLIYEGGTAEELSHYWRILQTELKREQELIEKLLTVGRLESGRYQLKKQAVDILPALFSALDEIRSLANARAIHLEEKLPERLPPVLADLSALQQVFVNLLSNAVKFTLTGGSVYFEAEEIGSGVQVKVRDTGIGIPPQDVPMLFQRFYRASNAIQNEIQGTGVGLFIVKSMIEQHGGQVGVESQLGQGTTFTVWLPLADQAAAD